MTQATAALSTPGGSPDVLVVGGGPAGLATAIACALKGFDVVVLERQQQQPIDKACGEGLMPDAVAVLDELGVRPHGSQLGGIRYADETSTVCGRFDPEQTGFGLGVRRTELGRALSERALALGVKVRLDDPFVEVRAPVGGEHRHVVSASGEWRPTVIVGADGARSSVRKTCGLDVRNPVGEPRRVGLRAHFEQSIARAGSRSVERGRSDRTGCTGRTGRTGRVGRTGPPLVEVFWAQGVEAYLTPVDERTFGLAFLFSADAGDGPGDRSAGSSRFDQLLSRFPELEQRVAASTCVSRTRGVGPLRQRASAHAVDNVALVGDAGGYVDAITGEGLAIAFAEAKLLAATLAEWGVEREDPRVVARSLRRFHRRAARHRRLPELLTEGALRLARRPWLRRRFLAALAGKPVLFDRVLRLHARSAGDHLAIPLAVALSWRMALALPAKGPTVAGARG